MYPYSPCMLTCSTTWYMQLTCLCCWSKLSNFSLCSAMEDVCWAGQKRHLVSVSTCTYPLSLAVHTSLLFSVSSPSTAARDCSNSSSCFLCSYWSIHITWLHCRYHMTITWQSHASFCCSRAFSTVDLDFSFSSSSDILKYKRISYQLHVHVSAKNILVITNAYIHIHVHGLWQLNLSV